MALGLYFDAGRRYPYVLEQALRTTGWHAFDDNCSVSNAETFNSRDVNFILRWRGYRPTHLQLKQSQQKEREDEIRKVRKITSLYNHFPDSFVITGKGHLQFYLKYACMKFGDIYDFAPRSWLLTPLCAKYVIPYEERRACMNKETTHWIGKPSNLSRGRGIKITSSLSDMCGYLNQMIEKNKGKTPGDIQVTDKPDDSYTYMFDTPTPALTTPAPEEKSVVEKYHENLLVVQEYIKNPYLIEGYKFDLRLYVLVTSFDPLRVYLYSDGLARFCTKPYSLDDFDRIRHLTNSSIQNTVKERSSPLGDLTPEERAEFVAKISNAMDPYDQSDFSKRDLRIFLNYLNTRPGVNIKLIWNQIQNVINLTMLSVYNKQFNPAYVGTTDFCFELFGFDIFITDNLEVKLVEVNLGPSLSVSSEVDVQVKQPMCEDMLELIRAKLQKLSAFDHKRDLGPTRIPLKSLTDPDPFVDEQRVGDFELIFPFNKHVEKLSRGLLKEEKEVNRCMAEIIEEIKIRKLEVEAKEKCKADASKKQAQEVNCE